MLLLVGSSFAELTTEQRVEDFEHFWNAYKNAYVFFELKKKDHGVDWDAIKGDFMDRMKNSESDLDLYAAVTEAQTLLRDGHCYNGSFSKIRETEKVYFQRIGITMVEGRKVVVFKVPADTEFEKAGIKPGYELVKFEGRTIRQMARAARKQIGASSESQFWAIFSGQLYIHSPLLGKPRSRKAEMIFRDPDGELVTVYSPWQSAPPTGVAAAETAWINDESGVKLDEAVKQKVSGPLPIEVRIFEEANLGYVKIDSWMKTEDPIEQFEQVFDTIKDTEGMILDLRGNGGGVGPWGILFANYMIEKSSDSKVTKSWISKVADWFKGKHKKDVEVAEADPSEKVPNDSWFERKLSKIFFQAAFPQLTDEMLTEIFTKPEAMQVVLKKAFGMDVSMEEINSHYKDGELEPFYVNLALNDRVNKIKPYLKPVYVLTDGGCYSTTDICLSILKEFERIKIVGTPNGAGSGSPIPFVLPHSKLQVYVPHARAFPPFGTMIEGRPLQPDTVITQTKEDLLVGKDTVLTEAVRQLIEEVVGTISTFVDTSEVMPLTHKDIDWGNIPMPDWAIQATLEHIDRNNINLNK
jgi:C-terminal processing protease CtpA/Prc